MKSNFRSRNMPYDFFLPILCLASTAGASARDPKAALSNLHDLKRDTCQSDSGWQATQAAWIADGTDAALASWWANVSSKPHQSFANELGEGFGAHLNGFQCGIGDYSTCTAPTCSDYQTALDPAWSYQAILSVVNLNTFFNSLYTGITNGQADYLGLTGDIAETFFPWKNPAFILGDATFWIVAVLTALFALPAGLVGEESAIEAGVAAAGISAFVGAGVQQVSYTLQPDPISAQMAQSEGLAALNEYATQAGVSSRNAVETWANATFWGEDDSENKNILDYLYNGTFSGSNLPSPTQIELFYKQQMISRIINSQWSTQKIFLTFFRTDDPNDASGPSESKYYSAADGGVYYLYRYSENGVLKGHLDTPWGLDVLNATPYSISAADITKASARAFRIGGFNYTQAMAQQRIVSSLSSNGALTPFADGAGWEGTWTLPVCDTGTNNWNTQYGNQTSSRYGMLPCCCGTNCTDTKAFVKAANMENFQTLLYGCESQLSGSGTNFSAVDYGYSKKKSLPLWWATLGKAKEGGVVIGMIVGGFISFFVLLGCCVAVCACAS